MATDIGLASATFEAPAFLTGSAGFGPAVKRWSVDEYHRMMDVGLIREGAPIELIDGMLLYKDRRDRGGSIMTQGSRHRLAVAQLVEWNTELARLGLHIGVQSSLDVSTSHEPEPDGVVLPGRPVQYAGRLPRADEALIVIEVADSSLDFDRSVKQRMYATATIPVYWIVNLRENRVEVYSRPDVLTGQYADRHDYGVGDVIELTLPGTSGLSVRVEQLIADAK